MLSSRGLDVTIIGRRPVLVIQFDKIRVGRCSNFQDWDIFESTKRYLFGRLEEFWFQRFSFERDHFVLHTKVVFVDTCYRQRWARKWPPWRRSRTPRFLWSDKLPGTRRIDLLATFVVDSPRLWLSVSRSVGLWIWQTCRHYCPGREVKRLLQRDLYSFSINSTTRSVRFIKFFHFAF